jgi:predicted nucleic acid-binding protein
MPSRALVVDANILVRAVLGRKVRNVIEGAGNVSFFVPETALVEAEEHVAALAAQRGGDPEIALAFLRSLSDLV